MSLVRRLILVAAAVVVVLGVVALGTFAWVARQFRPSLVFEVEGPNETFQFWVDLPFLDEGDPSVVLAVVDPGREDREARHLVGFIDWGDRDNIEQWVHLGDGHLGDIGYVTVAGEPARPLLLWKQESGEYVPTDNDADLEQPWVAAALSELADQAGEAACIGRLSAQVVECRYRSPQVSPDGG